MPFPWKSSVAFVGIPFGAYLVFDNKFSRKYPLIPLQELPKEMQVHTIIQSTDSKYTFPYCDNFRATIRVPENESLQSLNEQILSKSTMSSEIRKKMIPISFKEPLFGTNDCSKLIRWKWPSDSNFVSNFEWLASWGYPFRLMNGGYHEFYIVKQSKEKYVVYFANTHEYNNLKDNKVIPKWVSHLHTNYARFILWQGVKEWEE